MVINRGEIWWASLPIPIGSEPGYKRPVLIVQDDAFNRSRLNTVIAVVITSNLALAEAPGNIYLPKGKTNLPKDSVANVAQIVTIDKGFLTERVGAIDEQLMDRVDNGLRMVLYL